MTKSRLKVALVHDVFIEHGGAEKVLLAILKLFPGAQVYIPLMTDEARRIVQKAGAGKVITSIFNHVPFIHSASILLKPFLFWYWESLDLGQYDLVISSSHSFSSKAVKASPRAVHISYIHTSPRYLYSEFNETQIIQKPFFKVILRPLLAWLRRKDYLAAQNPDVLIANSLEVQLRIRRYYRRDSQVIYPPVEIPAVSEKMTKKRYYVCFSRLAKQKGIDLAVQACTALNRPLKVIGEGSQAQYLRSLAGKTIQFLGRVPDKKLPVILAGAKGMIYPALQEDFGMAPVEAMAHGVPVIAHRSGGVVESVVDGKTGIFFDDWTASGVIEGIKKFEQKNFSAAA
jgi:glycosyltransferase involved in cell wall biosynthesis